MLQLFLLFFYSSFHFPFYYNMFLVNISYIQQEIINLFLAVSM